MAVLSRFLCKFIATENLLAPATGTNIYWDDNEIVFLGKYSPKLFTKQFAALDQTKFRKRLPSRSPYLYNSGKYSPLTTKPLCVTDPSGQF